MDAPNKHWARWILASATKHFQTMASTNGIAFHIRGLLRKTASEDEFVEFYMEGPFIVQLSANYFRLTVGINVLYSVDITTDYHADMELVGKILESFTQICVYKYGDGVDDDDTYLGRLAPVQGITDKINVNTFGVKESNVKVKMGSVEAEYEIYLAG